MTTVRIGMPLFNEGRYLRQAFDSLLAQDFTDFEIVISDNASTDETPAICREYAARDRRIAYRLNDANIGMTANQNRVLDGAETEFFMWAAGHDLWHPTFLTRCVAVLRADPEAALAYPVIDLMDESGRRFADPKVVRLDTRGLGVSSRANLLLWGLATCNSVYGLYRTAAIKQTGLFRNVVISDNLILFELSLVGSIAHIPEPLLTLRIRTDGPATMGASLDAYRKKFYPPDRKWFRLWMTHWRLFYEHLAAVAAAPIKLGRKPVLFASVLFAFLARRGKHMVHDIIESLGLPRP